MSSTILVASTSEEEKIKMPFREALELTSMHSWRIPNQQPELTPVLALSLPNNFSPLVVIILVFSPCGRLRKHF